MKARILIGVLVLAAVGVGAYFLFFSGDDLDHGTITEREYQSATTFVSVIPLCTTTGGKYPTTTCTPIPYVMYDDEDWVFHLRDGERTGEVYVDESTYADYAVGDYFGIEGHNASTDDPHENRGEA